MTEEANGQGRDQPMPSSSRPGGGASIEVYQFDAGQSIVARFADGLMDLREAAGMMPIWLVLAWRDFLQQTRRTFMGPLWSIIGTGITVTVLGYVYGAVLKMNGSTVFPHIAAGLVIWFFISGCINGGLSVYISARGVLEERALPVAFSAFRFVFRYMIELIVKFVVFALAAAAVALPMNVNAFLALPGLVILILNGLWVVLVFGPLGARYRDVSQVVSPLMLIAFLASPVLWPEGMLGGSGFIATFNPFTHFLAIVRDPLLGSPPSMLSVVVTLAVTVGGSVLAVVCHCLYKDRIVFWI